LNIKDEQKPKDILFFNFAFEANEMLLNLDQTHVYQAWLNKEATILLAESNSYNSLADQLKVSVGTVRNNMDCSLYEEGYCTINGESTILDKKKKISSAFGAFLVCVIK
jgi:transcriptional antiterminator